MNDMWDEHTTGLMRVRWQEPVAMSETITRAAEDVDHIANRIKEIAAERVEAQRQCDPEHATGDNLDRVGADWADKRSWTGESDTTFRERLLKKIRGE